MQTNQKVLGIHSICYIACTFTHTGKHNTKLQFLFNLQFTVSAGNKFSKIINTKRYKYRNKLVHIKI